MGAGLSMQIEILLAIQTLLLGLVGYLMKSIYDDYKEYRRNTEKRLDEIEHNYLHRFEMVHAKINESEKKIVELLTQIKYDNGDKSKAN